MTSSTQSGQLSRFESSTLDDGEIGKRRVRRFSGRIVDSLLLLINVYANENYLHDAERPYRISSESENSSIAVSSSNDVNRFSGDEHSPESSLIVEKVNVTRSALLSKYLEDYHLISENSLCKKMMKIASIRPMIFSIDQSRHSPIVDFRSDLEEVTNLLVKLKKYLSQQCRRLKKFSSNGTQTPSSVLCDKAVQCSKSTEFLKVKPESRLFSRSSLEEKSSDRRQRRDSSTCRQNLRSFSSSAIFRPRSSAAGQKIKLRRRPKYSNEVLLEDYVTEVKELVRSRRIEEEREARILRSVKRRMDRDLHPSRPDSWRSLEDDPHPRLSPCTSYETARSCCCSFDKPSRCCCCCCCLGEGDRLLSCEALVLCTNCSLRARRRIAGSCTSRAEDKASKSSRSVDSGVLLNCCYSSSSSSDDKNELLCQRVELAVRKFTEELILCERRARDRSSSTTRRRLLRLGRRSRTSATDQSSSSSSSSTAGLNYLRKWSDEEENIAEISTPSLVSLSDSELHPT